MLENHMAKPIKYIWKTCPHCSGKKEVDGEECQMCGGEGQIKVEE